MMDGLYIGMLILKFTSLKLASFDKMPLTHLLMVVVNKFWFGLVYVVVMDDVVVMDVGCSLIVGLIGWLVTLMV